MKRILLLMWVLLLGISVQAQTTITLSGGDLQTKFEAFLASPPETLIIEGTLNSDDAAYLKSIGCQNILMDNASFEDEPALEAISFANNTTVKNIVLPKNMQEVKPAWFSGCTALNAAISYSSDSKTIKAHVNTEGTLRTTIDKAQGLTRTSIEEAILSGNVGQKELSKQYSTENAFQGCHIKHFDLTNCTMTASDLVYAGCDGYANTDYLEQIELPTGLTAIPSQCFIGCKYLRSIYLPSTIQTIGTQAFEQCSSLETVEFGKGFTSLSFGANVFTGNTSLKHIVLPEGLQNIGDGLFDRCTSLMSIRLPNSLQHIGSAAFRECKAMTYLTIPSGVKTIGENAFAQSGIEDIYLMAQTVEDLPYIASNAFGDTPFNGNNSLAMDNHIDEIVERVVKLVERGVITEVTAAQVQAWGNKWKSGNYSVTDMPDKNILQYVPTEEMEQMYREFVGASNTIAYLHYPRVDNDGTTATELSFFIDGNPWKGQNGLLDNIGGFYSRGRLNPDGSDAGSTLRNITIESPRLRDADHLSDAYGIGPDAAGNYWPDTNHDDKVLRSQYGDPNSAINASDQWKTWTSTDNMGITIDSDDYSGSYVGYSKYYWRNFLLQSGYSPNNDEVFSKYYDDTWYTMCFPFDLTDEQLEAAYQSNKFNICEFSGAAILPSMKKNNQDEDVEVQNLVLCFTKIARTWYKDKYGNYYKRTRDNDQTKHYYTAERTWVERTDGTSDWDLTNISPTEFVRIDDKDDPNFNADIWDSIDGILALAGHPYMIHPYLVENLDGTATLCTIPKVVYKFDFNRRGTMDSDKLAQTMNNIAELYAEEAVTRPICTITNTNGIFMKDQDGVTQGDGKTESYGRYDDMTATTLGNYTFKGSYFPKKGEEIATGETTEQVIPFGAYFLGVKKKSDTNASARDKKYPKFYREISTNPNRTTGLWKQYTAIITPDDNAMQWEAEHLTGPTQTIQTGAKGMSMLFGDFEDIVDENVIQGIATEAERMGLEVKRTDIIVNINGQILRPGKGVEGLPKGIYIINGKKYLVK